MKKLTMLAINNNNFLGWNLSSRERELDFNHKAAALTHNRSTQIPIEVPFIKKVNFCNFLNKRLQSNHKNLIYSVVAYNNGYIIGNIY